jgi:hypothetical protein
VTPVPANWKGPAIFVVPFAAVPRVIVPVPIRDVPMLIAVVEPVAPLVPMLTVLVRPVVVAPDAMLNVDVAVVPNAVKDVVPAPSVNVVAAPAIDRLVVTVLNAANVASPTMDVTTVGVVSAGDVARARTVPEPVVVYDVPHALPVEFGIPAPG